MSRIRICRVCEQFPPGKGGLASGMFDLSVAQHDRGHQVTVVTNSCQGDAEFDAQVPFTVIRVEAKRISHFAWKAFNVVKSLNFRPDIIHLHGPSAAVFIKRRRSDFPPIIQTMHAVRKYQLELFRDFPAMVKDVERRTCFIAKDKPSYYGRFSTGVIKDLLIEKYICNRVDHVAVVAEYFADQIKEYYHVPQERITVTYNGSRFKQEELKNTNNTSINESNLGPNKNVILYVGRTDWVKRVHLLVEAMPIVHSIFPESQLVIVGDGDQQGYLQGLVGKLSLDECVRFLGWVPHSQLPQLFRISSCFCLPSYWEGLSKSLLEAMSAMVPVVASENLSNKEILGGGKYGWLVEEPTPQAWGEKIMHVLSGGSKIQEIVADAANVVDRMYRWEHVAKRLDTAYETMLDR